MHFFRIKLLSAAILVGLGGVNSQAGDCCGTGYYCAPACRPHQMYGSDCQHGEGLCSHCCHALAPPRGALISSVPAVMVAQPAALLGTQGVVAGRFNSNQLTVEKLAEIMAEMDKKAKSEAEAAAKAKAATAEESCSADARQQIADLKKDVEELTTLLRQLQEENRRLKDEAAPMPPRT